MVIRKWLPLLAFLTGLVANTLAASEIDESSDKTWSVVPTENHVIQSRALGKGIRLQVTVPADYAPDTETYPVLYYLDAFIIGGTVRETAYNISRNNEMPPDIMVGIELEVNTRDEWDEQRSFILTPTQSDIYEQFGIQKSWTGGAAHFLESLESEIIPFIDTNYPARIEDKAIVGHSFGGLFALYALFEKPSLFQRYLVSSPSLPWDNRVTFKNEAAYAAKNEALPAHVFMSVGELENGLGDAMVEDFFGLVTILRARKYTGLHLTSKLFEGENHSSVWSVAYSRGLREIYRQ